MTQERVPAPAFLLLSIVDKDDHLVVLNANGVPIMPAICMHGDPEIRATLNSGSPEQIIALTLGMLARAFDNQIQRYQAEWN